VGQERSILRDVAVAAQVSLRTASRVLNDDPRVASGTRERVRQAMKDLDYHPDLTARSLRGGTDSTFALVVESIADPFFAELVAATESGATEMGKSVLVGSTNGDPDREFRVVTQLLQRRVSGLLLVPTSSDHGWLATAPAPVVLVDRPAAGLAVDVVCIDDEAAAFEAVSHLIRHGHRDIAYIGDHPGTATSVDRLAGYRRALAHHGVDVVDRFVHADCPDAATAATAVRELLAGERPPTALFSSATRSSLGVVPAMHQLGRTDIALVAFGDFAMADTLTPGVSVVDHSGAAVGRTAMDRLVERTRNPDLPVEIVQVPVTLVERGSGELRPGRPAGHRS
jgi:LacI family transcriptional regulator